MGSTDFLFPEHLDILLDMSPPYVEISEFLAIGHHRGWSWLPHAIIKADVFLSQEIIIPNALMILRQKQVTKTWWPSAVVGLIGCISFLPPL